MDWSDLSDAAGAAHDASGVAAFSSPSDNVPGNGSPTGSPSSSSSSVSSPAVHLAPVERFHEPLEVLAQRAASAIHAADYVCFHFGAGMGVDSGLATYCDVARLEPYIARDLDYYDLCQPDWRLSDPATFYGFWGSCFNRYTAAEPHEGYRIVQRWRDIVRAKAANAFVAEHERRYRDAMAARDGDHHDDNNNDKSASTAVDVTWPLPRAPIYTSNVDGLAARIAPEHERLELHGDSATWQCGDRCAASANKLWVAPRDWRFDVDDATMLCAPRDKSAPAELLATPCESRLDAAQLVPSYGPLSFASPFPTCPDCNALARPAILMFNDMLWCRKQGSMRNYSVWSDTFFDTLVARRDAALVVVEVGCGKTVPSVRNRSENVIFEYLWKAGGQREDVALDALPVRPTLVRINPDFPHADSSLVEHCTLPMRGGALQCLRMIDAELMRLQQRAAE